MPHFRPIERIIRSRAVKEYFAYFRSVPSSRLAMVAAAAFCVCTAAGLIASLVDATVTNWASGLCLGALFGFSSALWVVVLSRKPFWFPLPIMLQILLSFVVTRLMLWIGRTEAPVPFKSVAQLYSILALILMLCGYALFFWFIQAEGRFAFRAQTELALAQSLQQTLVPVIDLTIAGCEIYGISVPSEKMGGDLVDVVSLPNGNAVAYLADIAGHGLSAGILMGMFKAAARASLAEATETEELFENLNRVIPSVKEAYMYATCVAFRLRSSPGAGCDVQFSIAGQPPILHLPAAGQPHPRLIDEQFPLGLMSWTGYRSQSVFAKPGDLLVAVSDGVLEVTGKDGVEFGTDSLERLIMENTALSLRSLAQRIFAAVSEKGRQEDDQTLLLIRVS